MTRYPGQDAAVRRLRERWDRVEVDDMPPLGTRSKIVRCYDAEPVLSEPARIVRVMPSGFEIDVTPQRAGTRPEGGQL